MECLDDETVLALVEGRLECGSASDITTHIESCAACRTFVVDVVGGLSDDDVRAVPATGEHVGRYILEGTIGAGAMGIVYDARDPDLGRRVALKLIRQSDGSAGVRDRLLREARAMAQLSHPNVIAVHDVGTIGDEVFLAMDRVDGGTLARWVRESLRSWRDVVTVFRQAGEGLAAAHAAGLVHRDFKPDNVLVGTDGRVYVTDFGLARWSEREDAGIAQGGSRELTATVTQTGTLLGTPAYMAPEQLAGASADVRSDVFSFSVALYEALYGQRPYDATDLDALAQQIASEKLAASPANVRVPAWLRRVVVAGLRADPDKRPQTMRAVLDALEDGLARARRPTLIGALGLAAAIAVVLVVFATARGSRAGPIRTIGVLPFADASTPAEPQWMTEAITGEIIDALAEVPALNVAPRAASFAAAGRSMHGADAARALGVAAVLEGTVRRIGARLSVTARVIGADGAELWSGELDRDALDGFAIGAALTRSVTAALGIPAGATRIGSARTSNLDAYEMYLRGRQYGRGWTENNYEVAIQLFERAIELDPGFAEPHAGIADADVHRLQWGVAAKHEASVRDEALHQADEALRLDPELGEGHLARANTLWLLQRGPEAEREYDRAIALSPGSRDAWYDYGCFLFAAGRYAEALRAYDAAVTRDPDDYNAMLHIAMAYRKLGDAARLREATQNALAATDRTLRYEPDNLRALYLSGLSLVQLGNKVDGERRLEQALALAPHDVSVLYNAACAYAIAGEPTRALDLLDRFVATGQGFRTWLVHDPDLDSLRASPRFQEILDRIPPDHP